jgi:hypothetical protein
MERLRQAVHERLPEVEQITDETPRAQVVELHARALAETEYARIEEIPPPACPRVR